MSRPTVALYHHLPPGGADRAMYELTRRTADRYRYVLYEIAIGGRDPFIGAARSPMLDVVDEHRTVPARAGGTSRLSRWIVTIPSVVRAERRISAEVNLAAPSAVVCHHQRFTQAPSLLHDCAPPTIYMLQEPRRRGFEYALAHPDPSARGLSRLGRAATALPEHWARQRDIRLTRSAGSILCNSDHSREYVWRAYGRDATVLRFGVDTDLFKLPSVDERDDEVLAVGALDATKGHDLAIRAVGAVDQAIRPRLRIVANRAGELAAELQAAANEHGVDLAIEYGLSDEDLVRRYQRAHAIILAARVEPLGLTALEAFACGTPVVAVREGGYRETVIDGTNGWLCDRNPRALADQIARVMKGEFPGSRATLRDDVLRRYDWTQPVSAYVEAVDRAIASR